MEEIMVTNFITVLNGVITGYHSGDIEADFFGTPYYNHERIEVPEDAGVQNFDKVDFYTPDWTRKPDIQLIDEGLIPMPEGYAREENKVRKLTPTERIISGLDNPEPGMKVENGVVVPMSFDERHKAGQITENEWLQIKLNEAENELNRRLAALNTEEAKATAELDEEYAVERKTKLAALLAVKKQKNWPFTVKWPIE
jgi:hypothetical protein